MSISSVSTKSTGFSAASTKSTDEQNNNTDGNPHPMNPNQNPATMGKDCGCEYHEKPAAGIDMIGVGSLACNDAACEQKNTHPDSKDLSDAGTMGTARVMRR